MLAWTKQAGIQISERQLYRDLNSLQHLNIAKGENVIEYSDEKNKKTWKLEYSASTIALGNYDINTFFLYKNFAPDCIIGERKTSFEKFEQLIYQQCSNNKYQQAIEANELYLQNTKFWNYNYSEIEHQKIEDLIWVLQNKRAITIDSVAINITNTKKTDQLYSLTFYPMQLLFHANRIAIAGLESSNQKLFIYSVEKHFNYTLTNKQFNRKKYEKTYQEQLAPRFGLPEPISNKVYHIKIEYTEDYGESHKNFFFHATQQWTKLKNGNYMFQAKCNISREMIGWLSYGLDKVKVHQPKILKDLLLKKLQQTIDIYQQKTAPNEVIANADY
jgi:hypothetical protein